MTYQNTVNWISLFMVFGGIAGLLTGAGIAVYTVSFDTRISELLEAYPVKGQEALTSVQWLDAIRQEYAEETFYEVNDEIDRIRTENDANVIPWIFGGLAVFLGGFIFDFSVKYIIKEGKQ